MEIKEMDLSLLISINDDIATIKDSKQLFFAIFMKLRNYYHLKIAGISLYNSKNSSLGSIIAKLDTPESLLDNPTIWFSSLSLDSIDVDLHLDDPRVLTVDAAPIFPYYAHDTSKQDIEEVFREMSVTALLLVPMQTGGEFVGFLIVPAPSTTLAREDQDYLIKIANLIASALSNARAYQELKQKEMIAEMQLSLLAELVTIKDKEKSYLRIAQSIDNLIPCDYLALTGEGQAENHNMTVSFVKDSQGNFKALPHTKNLSLSLSALDKKMVAQNIFSSSEIFEDQFEDLCKKSPYFRSLKEKHMIKSVIVSQYGAAMGALTMIIGRSRPFQFLKSEHIDNEMFSNVREAFFGAHEREMGLNILAPIALILANLLAFDEVQTLTKKLEQEKNYLLEEINLTHNFQEIIGNSDAIQQTLNKVKQVAPLDATVLIQGETGTGKELIARAVHNLSKRKENTFITVNCAALPAQLIESELFGHEKGSFTGAVEKKIGKFEVANKGTIFLDEIGELPLEIQAKLLRVLQEKEFERLGGKSTIHSDVRIIAATNRNLELEVAQGRFRADLFFRLNVFPISVPTLRNRTEDIPLLVKYFIEKFSKKLGKKVNSIKKSDLDLLMGYNWPGNIRELEHMVERAMIVSSGSHLNFESFINKNSQTQDTDWETFKTLEELEKEHIINALKTSNGKVTGEKSASQLLGINGKTLGSKMRKLKIKREISISVEDK